MYSRLSVGILGGCGRDSNFAHSGGGLDVYLMRVEFWVFVGVAKFSRIAQLSVGFV